VNVQTQNKQFSHFNLICLILLKKPNEFDYFVVNIVNMILP